MKTLLPLVLASLVLIGCGGSAAGNDAPAEPKAMITINHRTVIFQAPEKAEDSDIYTFEEKTYFADTVGLLIIDAWKSTGNEGFDARASANARDFLAPFVDRMRAKGVQIYHMPYESWSRGNALEVHPEDIVLNDATTPVQLHAMLEEKGIRTLLMAGYALNYCLLQRPLGLWPLILANQIERIVLVRDCTIAKEISATIQTQGAYHTIVNMVEMWDRGSTVISDEVL